MNITVIGGTGLLGKELQKTLPQAKFFGREMDIADCKPLFGRLTMLNTDVVLHLAALTDSNYVDKNQTETIDTNIIGTANISKWCIKYNKRLVYVSTDYVYDGDLDHEHHEDEALKPKNLYGISKLAGECCVKFVPNHCIIRTSFGSPIFPYKKAYKNLIVSKDYVDVIAPMIRKLTMSDFIGVINVGTETKSIYDYANRRNVVEEDFLSERKNYSLNTDRYKNLNL